MANDQDIGMRDEVFLQISVLFLYISYVFFLIGSLMGIISVQFGSESIVVVLARLPFSHSRVTLNFHIALTYHQAEVLR